MLSVHRLAAFVTLVAGVLANPSPMGDCNGQSYDTNAYTCYDGMLCPMWNGAPTKRCGDSCYYEFRYNCENGNLVERPQTEKPFYMVAHNPQKFSYPLVNACGGKFLIRNEPVACSYCPPRVRELGGTCPPGIYTVLAAGHVMDVVVPGGQQYFVGPDGALGFTMPHSSFMPEGSKLGALAFEGGAFVFPGTIKDGWMACERNATNGGSLEYQIYAHLPNMKFGNECFETNILTVQYDDSHGAAAWEYI